MTSEVVLLILGMVGTLSGSVLTALFVRRRTNAESGNLDASAAKTITDAAADLIEMVRKDHAARIAEVERRQLATEQRAADANTAAQMAREAERQCHARLAALEVEIVGLKTQIATMGATTVTEPTPNTELPT